MPTPHIEKRIELLEQAELEYKTHKEMLNDALANDGELASLDEKLKEAKRRYTAQKEAVMNEPENRKVQEKMKDVAGEIKDTKKLLADELIAYFMEHKSFDYVDAKGKKRHIAVSAKFSRAPEEE